MLLRFEWDLFQIFNQISDGAKRETAKKSFFYLPTEGKSIFGRVKIVSASHLWLMELVMQIEIGAFSD